MTRDRELLRHYLGAVAYRTQEALRGEPPRARPAAADAARLSRSHPLRHATRQPRTGPPRLTAPLDR